MPDLKPMTALGGHEPRTDRFDHVTIAENDGLALASVAARLGHEAQCQSHLKDLVGDVPAPGKATLLAAELALWMGPDQWMITAPKHAEQVLADSLKSRFAGTASITEQTGAWACFDLEGSGLAEVSERLCAVPIRQMQPGDAQRSVIHQLGCFVIMMGADHLRLLGPRASAQTLHTALLNAAASTA